MNKHKLKQQLQDMFELEVDHLRLSTSNKGTTNTAYQVTITYSTGVVKELILKYDADWLADFYNKFLEPNNLSHPRIFGKIETGEGICVAMEYIKNPKQKWSTKDYMKLIDWLVLKNYSLKLSQGFPSMENQLRKTMLATFKELLTKAKSENLLPALEKFDKSAIEAFIEGLTDLVSIVSTGTQVLLHQDLSKRNSIVTQAGNLYVIDWQYPRSGNPLFDLTKLLVNKDAKIQKALIKYYRSLGEVATDQEITQFLTIQQAAYLHWYLDSHFSGRINIANDSEIDFLLATNLNNLSNQR